MSIYEDTQNLVLDSLDDSDPFSSNNHVPVGSVYNQRPGDNNSFFNDTEMDDDDEMDMTPDDSIGMDDGSSDTSMHDESDDLKINGQNSTNKQKADSNVQYNFTRDINIAKYGKIKDEEMRTSNYFSSDIGIDKEVSECVNFLVNESANNCENSKYFNGLDLKDLNSFDNDNPMPLRRSLRAISRKLSKEMAGNEKEPSSLHRLDYLSNKQDLHCSFSNSPGNGESPALASRMVVTDSQTRYNAIVVTCSYCHLRGIEHHILTHEIVSHSNEIAKHIEQCSDYNDLRSLCSKFRLVIPREGLRLQYKCKICLLPIGGYAAKDIGHLRAHVYSAEHACTFCNYSKNMRCYATRHMATHMDYQTEHERDQVVAAFNFARNPSSLSEEELSLLEAGSLSAVKCEPMDGTSLVSPEQKKRYYAIGNKHKRGLIKSCSYCSYYHSNELYILTHEALIHGKELIENLNHENTLSSITGRFCGKVEGSVKPFCKLCGSIQSSISGLHFFNHLNGHFGDYSFKCEWCTFSSEDASKIGKHSILHLRVADEGKRRKYLMAIDSINGKVEEGPETGINNDPDLFRVSLGASGTSKRKGQPTRITYTDDYLPAIGLSSEDHFSSISVDPEMHMNLQDTVIANHTSNTAGSVMCSFCDFSHDSKLYTVTHETLKHSDLLIQQIDNSANETLKVKFVDDVRGCLLCGNKRQVKGSNEFIRHLKCHVAPGNHRCRQCTFKAVSSRNMSMHEMFTHRPDRSDRTYLRAIEYVNGLASGDGDNDVKYTSDNDPIISTTPKTFPRVENVISLAPSPSSHISERMPTALIPSSRSDKRPGSYTCHFCHFEQPEELLTFTHEVLTHADLLEDYIRESLTDYTKYRKGNMPVIVKFFRVFSKSNGRSGAMCKLCGFDTFSFKYKNLIQHFLAHIKSSDVNCSFCTYSSKKCYMGRHEDLHKQYGTAVNTSKFNLAINYVKHLMTQGKNGERKVVQKAIRPTDGINENEISAEDSPSLSYDLLEDNSSDLDNDYFSSSHELHAVEESVDSNVRNDMGYDVVIPSSPDKPTSDIDARTLSQLSVVDLVQVTGILKCPMCLFLCNDEETIINHVVSHRAH